MDPITHTLAGATMARAGLDRRTPMATAALLLGANAPDIDILTAFGGPNAALALRRGCSHGPLAIVALPFAVTGLLLAWDRWVRRRRTPDAAPAEGVALLQLATIGVLSHPMLDWLNTYGIRLLMPFSDHWFRGNSLFIIDPYLWLILAVGLVMAARVGAGDAPRAWRLVRVSGSAALVYIAMMITLSAIGTRVGRSVATLHGIGNIEEVLYSPRPADPLAADLVVRTPDAYHLGVLHWLSSERATLSGAVIARGDWAAPVVQRARMVLAARNYLVWSQFQYVRVDISGTDTSVFFGDARYYAGLAGGLGGLRVEPPPVR
jgi:inner membrane protein